MAPQKIHFETEQLRPRLALMKKGARKEARKGKRAQHRWQYPGKGHHKGQRMSRLHCGIVVRSQTMAVSLPLRRRATCTWARLPSSCQTLPSHRAKRPFLVTTVLGAKVGSIPTRTPLPHRQGMKASLEMRLQLERLEYHRSWILLYCRQRIRTSSSREEQCRRLVV